MQKALSIVVPVYNVDSYLEQCLLSIVNQTLPAENFEVILVDDKSTDGSLAICQNFCNKYPNFKLIALPENTPGGAGIPSNKGIDAAKGLYIGFVDSDDFVDPTMFEKLLAVGLKNESDVVYCDFLNFDEEKQRNIASSDKNKFKAFVQAKLQKMPLREQKRRLLSFSPVPWRKIYKKTFIDKYHIRYPEGNFPYEDNAFNWYTTTLAESFSFIDEALLTHRIGRKGQTTLYNPEKVIGHVYHEQSVAKFLKGKGLWDEYKIDFLRWTTGQFLWVHPKLGDKTGAYVKVLRKILSDITFADLLECRNVFHQRKADVVCNFCLLHGFYRSGLWLRKLLLNQHGPAAKKLPKSKG